VVLLVLAAFAPPTRMASYLLADAPDHGSPLAKKPPQARGRNRIGSPPRPDAVAVVAGLGKGPDRASRASHPQSTRPRTPAPVLPRTAPTSPIPAATLRLRC
jgi:hypothetical protein